MSLKRSLVFAAAGLAALTTAVAFGGAPVSARPADVQSFLAAAALQPGDVPTGMTIQTQGPMDPSEIAQLGTASGDATLATDALGGYQQGLLATDLTSALFGQPALGGVAIIAFASTDTATAAQAALVQNGTAAVQQLTGNSDMGITIGNITTLTPPAIGDEAQEFEATGSIPFGGQTFNVTLDIVVARRGAVQFEAVAGGLQSEQSVAEALATAVDTNVQANLGLLAGS